MAEEDRYTRITLRIPKGVTDKLKRAADSRSHSMNAEIVQRLERSFSIPEKVAGEPIPETVFSSVTDSLQAFLRDQIAAATEKVVKDIEEKYMSREGAALIEIALKEPETLTRDQIRALGQQALSMVTAKS